MEKKYFKVQCAIIEVFFLIFLTMNSPAYSYKDYFSTSIDPSETFEMSLNLKYYDIINVYARVTTGDEIYLFLYDFETYIESGILPYIHRHLINKTTSLRYTAPKEGLYLLVFRNPNEDYVIVYVQIETALNFLQFLIGVIAMISTTVMFVVIYRKEYKFNQKEQDDKNTIESEDLRK